MIRYQLITESEEWSVADVVNTSTDYDSLLKEYHELLGECLMESVIDNNNVDYVCIESVREGEDVGEVCVEYIFNEPSCAS